MATTTVFVFICALSMAIAQIGLPCMQKDHVQKAVLRCFSGFKRSNTINLDPSDRSGTLGQALKLVSDKACSQEGDMVDGLDCFYDFYGTCLNMRQLLPSRSNIKSAINFGCKHKKDIRDPCLDKLVKGMLTCFIGKVKERQISILMGKVKVRSLKEETCRYYDEELKCLDTAPSTCASSTKNVLYNYLKKLIPDTCKIHGLPEILKSNSILDRIGLTRMSQVPR